MNKNEKKDRHNYLLNVMIKLNKINDKNLNIEEKQKLLNEKTKVANEIEQIRKELNVNTSTYINDDDIN